jgi:hypothetical protein
MNQTEVLKLIALWFGGLAGAAITVTLLSLNFLRRKTVEKHNQRVQHIEDHPGQTC